MKRKIVVTGLGLIGDFGAGKFDLCDFLSGKTAQKRIDDFNFDDYIDTALLRRADNNSIFAAIAAKLAIDDAKFDMKKVCTEKWGAVLGTTHGPLAYTMQYHRELAMGRPQMASPLLFSNSVLNAMVSYVSAIFHVRGYTTTLSGYNSVLQAIKCAADLITQKVIDVCLVGGVDIFDDVLKEAYSNCINDSYCISCRFGGSGFLILESLESAQKRRADVYARILGSEIITADYAQSVKYDISPVKALLTKLQYKAGDIDSAITSCYGTKESRKRQGLYLKALKKNSIIMDSSSLFGHTFSAAEIFKVILGILSLQESFSLPEILNKGPFKNTLVMNVSKIGSNGCLLLERS